MKLKEPIATLKPSEMNMFSKEPKSKKSVKKNVKRGVKMKLN